MMSTRAVVKMQVHAPQTASTHILAVDDDPIIREAISDYLGHYEFRVTAVAHWGAMQAALAPEVIDFGVLDPQLVTEDGMALARPGADGTAPPIIAGSRA